MFEIGKGIVLKEGKDVSIFATGLEVSRVKSVFILFPIISIIVYINATIPAVIIFLLVFFVDSSVFFITK